MKLGLIADLHCNISALGKACQVFEGQGVDEILFLGDAIYEYNFSSAVVKWIKDNHVRFVLGNHEENFLRNEALCELPDNDPTLVSWLRQQERTLETTVGGLRLLGFHGSPWKPYDDYLLPNNPALANLDSLGYDIVVFGHTHWEFAQRLGRTLVINPGSAGQPRDHRNDLQCSVATLDTESLEVRFIRFPYESRIPQEEVGRNGHHF